MRRYPLPVMALRLQRRRGAGVSLGALLKTWGSTPLLPLSRWKPTNLRGNHLSNTSYLSNAYVLQTKQILQQITVILDTAKNT